MTVSYPVGDACGEVVARGATLRAQTARLGKPVNVAGPSWGSHRPMASCTSVFTGHPRLQRGSGTRADYLEYLPLRSWAVAASNDVSNSDRLQLGQ